MKILSGALLSALVLVVSCDGPRENAGERADAVRNAQGREPSAVSQEELGEMQDKEARDRKKAADAQADAVEHRADEVRASADQEADAMEKQADELRRSADPPKAR